MASTMGERLGVPDQIITILPPKDEELIVIHPIRSDFPKPGPQVVITSTDNLGQPVGSAKETTLDDLDW